MRQIVIDFGEHVAAETLVEMLNKNKTKYKEYSVFVPLSRQQKGIDLILYKNGSPKIATIQVKYSRSYAGSKPKGHIRTNFLTYNTFSINDEAKADFYLILGNYLATEEQFDYNKGFALNMVDYKLIVLLYTYEEMKEELSKVRQVKTEKQDSRFSYRFRDEQDIEMDRGFVEGYNTLNNGSRKRDIFVLEKRKQAIIDFFD